MKTPIEILKAAREIIAHPDNWTQGAFARNKLGKPVDSNDPIACSFCGLGAIYKATLSSSDRFSRQQSAEVTMASNALWQALDSDEGFIDFNDSRSHKQVLAVFDKAIESLSA